MWKSRDPTLSPFQLTELLILFKGKLRKPLTQIHFFHLYYRWGWKSRCHSALSFNTEDQCSVQITVDVGHEVTTLLVTKTPRYRLVIINKTMKLQNVCNHECRKCLCAVWNWSLSFSHENDFTVQVCRSRAHFERTSKLNGTVTMCNLLLKHVFHYCGKCNTPTVPSFSTHNLVQKLKFNIQY